MTLTLISNPDKIDGEHELVNALFDSGLDYFHLRKPGYSKAEMEVFLMQLTPKFIRKTLLHSHHGLVGKYNIGGFHFPASYLQNESPKVLKDLIKEAGKRRLRTGTSAHSISEAKELKDFDYFFLSPVFNSISKGGYKASFDFDELRDYFRENDFNKYHPKAIALGGIDENNMNVLKDIGFSGAALLGAIWKDYSKEKINAVVQKFRNIQMLAGR